MSDNNIKDYGVILRTLNYGELDKLVYIFLQNHGIVKAIAYGAKKSKKRFGGNLEPYNLLFFNIASKKNLYHIQEIKIVKLFMDIRKSLKSIEMLQSVSQILLKISLSPDKNLFKLFYFLLLKLNKPEVKDEMFKAYYLFLIYLLKHEGFFPPKNTCFNCGDNKETEFLVSPNREPHFLCARCLTDAYPNSYIANREVLNFINNSLKSPKSLFKLSFHANNYIQLNNILNSLISHFFHVTLPHLEY